MLTKKQYVNKKQFHKGDVGIFSINSCTVWKMQEVQIKPRKIMFTCIENKSALLKSYTHVSGLWTFIPLSTRNALITHWYLYKILQACYC